MSPLLKLGLNNCLSFKALELKASPNAKHQRAAIGISAWGDTRAGYSQRMTVQTYFPVYQNCPFSSANLMVPFSAAKGTHAIWPESLEGPSILHVPCLSVLLHLWDPSSKQWNDTCRPAYSLAYLSFSGSQHTHSLSYSNPLSVREFPFL